MLFKVTGRTLFYKFELYQIFCCCFVDCVTVLFGVWSAGLYSTVCVLKSEHQLTPTHPPTHPHAHTHTLWGLGHGSFQTIKLSSARCTTKGLSGLTDNLESLCSCSVTDNAAIQQLSQNFNFPVPHHHPKTQTHTLKQKFTLPHPKRVTHGQILTLWTGTASLHCRAQHPHNAQKKLCFTRN